MQKLKYRLLLFGSFILLLCCFISGDRESDPAPPRRDTTYKSVDPYGKPYGIEITHHGIKENVTTEK